jgi:hypothetical protein
MSSFNSGIPYLLPNSNGGKNYLMIFIHSSTSYIFAAQRINFRSLCGVRWFVTDVLFGNRILQYSMDMLS